MTIRDLVQILTTYEPNLMVKVVTDDGIHTLKTENIVPINNGKGVAFYFADQSDLKEDLGYTDDDYSHDDDHYLDEDMLLSSATSTQLADYLTANKSDFELVEFIEAILIQRDCPDFTDRISNLCGGIHV